MVKEKKENGGNIRAAAIYEALGGYVGLSKIDCLLNLNYNYNVRAFN